MVNEGMAITAKMQVKYKSTRSGKSGERVNSNQKYCFATSRLRRANDDENKQ